MLFQDREVLIVDLSSAHGSPHCTWQWPGALHLGDHICHQFFAGGWWSSEEEGYVSRVSDDVTQSLADKEAGRDFVPHGQKSRQATRAKDALSYLPCHAMIFVCECARVCVSVYTWHLPFTHRSASYGPQGVPSITLSAIRTGTSRPTGLQNKTHGFSAHAHTHTGTQNHVVNVTTSKAQRQTRCVSIQCY